MLSFFGADKIRPFNERKVVRMKKILISILLLIIPALISAFDCGYQGYKGCNLAEIEQVGVKNYAYIETSGKNKASINQEGFGNNAKIIQNFALFGNNADILQKGNHNSVYQHQIGINNYAYVEQQGTFNTATQNQIENNNSATVKQYGTGNTVSQNQYTSYNSSSALQIGFYNKAYQFQGLSGTIGNKSNLTQIGFGILTIIVQ